MGVEDAIIYVDTSWNGGVCQTGYHIEIGGECFEGSSAVFQCMDNNSAEVKGIQIACQKAIEGHHAIFPNKTGSYRFLVYNDNITAVTVSDSMYTPSIKARGRFQSTTEIKNWCQEQNVILKCIRKKRSHRIMKKCDRLSKKFRKEGKDGITRNEN